MSKTEQRNGGSKSVGSKADLSRCVTVSPPLDQDKCLNIFRSMLRFAVFGGMCVDEVDKAYTEAKGMM